LTDALDDEPLDLGGPRETGDLLLELVEDLVGQGAGELVSLASYFPTTCLAARKNEWPLLLTAMQLPHGPANNSASIFRVMIIGRTHRACPTKP
jgi:hypothetical protein